MADKVFSFLGHSRMDTFYEKAIFFYGQTLVHPIMLL